MGRSFMQTEPELRALAQALVDVGAASGFNVTIEQRPLTPPAIGYNETMVDVWPKRHAPPRPDRAAVDPGVIHSDSDEAAQLRAVIGWVSRDGFFFGADERTARYSGCTHRPCEDCGVPTPKSRTRCSNCQSKRTLTRFEAMPRKAWDGKAMLNLFDTDVFFSDLDEALDYASDNDIKREDLQLVICEPNRGRPLAEDYFVDELAEDGDVPDELVEAIAKFNEAIAKAPVLSWTPGKCALQLSPDGTRADLEAGRKLRHRGDNGLYFKDAEGRYWVKGGDRFGNAPDEGCTLTPLEVGLLFTEDDAYGFEIEEETSNG